MKPNLNNQLLQLSNLLQFQSKLRWATDEAKRFMIVNETINFVKYGQCFLYEKSDDFPKGEITAISGVSEIDQSSAASISAKKTIENHPNKSEITKSKTDEGYLLMIPLHAQKQVNWSGYLLFSHDKDFSDENLNILKLLADSYAHALLNNEGKNKYKVKSFMANKSKINKVFLAIALLCLFPVKESIIAPAEVIADDPILVRSPLNGTVKQIHVKPNDHIDKGELIVSLDESELESQLEIAIKLRNTAEQEYRQTVQQAINGGDKSLEISKVKGELARQNSEVEYLNQLSKRTAIYAEKSGVAVFQDPYDWIGRPVAVGEKIMLIADPNKSLLEIKLPANDAIDFPDNSPVSFFANSAPHSPEKASLSYVSYRASKTSESDYSYRAEALWDEKTDIKLGSKGSAKVYGKLRPFIWQVLRKPFATIRQWIGI